MGLRRESGNSAGNGSGSGEEGKPNAGQIKNEPESTPGATKRTGETDNAAGSPGETETDNGSLGTVGNSRQGKRGRHPNGCNCERCVARRNKASAAKSDWPSGLTDAQIEASVKMNMIMIIRAQDNFYMGICNRPPLTPAEESLQREALRDLIRQFGDPWGKWGPVFMGVMALTAPAFDRFGPTYHPDNYAQHTAADGVTVVHGKVVENDGDGKTNNPPH